MAVDSTNPLSLEPLNLFDTTNGITGQVNTPISPSFLIKTNCKESSELEEVTNIAAVGMGYCTGDITVGTSNTEQPVYPFPRLYHRAKAAERAFREAELDQAKIDNWFDHTILPGAVVHGNVSSPDVRRNCVWTVRGTEEQRNQFAHEADMGVDDAEPGEDAVDIFEALFPYFEKHWTLWAANPRVLKNIERLLSILAENALDGSNPDGVKLDMVDPILLFAPASRTQNVKHWDFYPDDPARYPKPDYFDEFRDDDVVAWLQVASSSPYPRIKPYTAHQENFQVTNEMFRHTEAFKNDDLDQAMAEGRVFIVDFKETYELNLRPPATESDGGRIYTPIAMFAVPKAGGPLKTIAIQSTQHTPQTAMERMQWKLFNKQDPERPLSDILTPASDYWSWQMVKTLFLGIYCGSGVVDHLSTHVFLGAIPVAFYRNIPSQHPLAALLEPHLMSLVANNHIGIFWEVDNNINDAESYDNPEHGLLTGLANKITGWSGKTFLDATVEYAGKYHFVEHSSPLDRKKDQKFSAIEDFPWHDDEGLFPIIERWVSGYLRLYYRYDDDVRMDQELQAFIYEITNEAQVNGFPDTINTIDGLVDMVTRLIYWMTNNHAFEGIISAVPIAPVGYWSDRVPRNDETKTEADWFNILPPINVGMATFCASRIFVDLPYDWHRSLGKYPKGQFMHDRRVYRHLERFQTEMFELDESIKQKNTSRRWAYNAKRPSTMTCSPWN